MSVCCLLLIESEPPDIQAKLADANLGVGELLLAKNLVEAISLLKRNVVDVVLLALDLHESKSLSYLRTIRSYTDTAVLVLSNNDDEILASHSLREGADEFLVKSRTTPSDLRRSILAAINRHEIRETVRSIDEKIGKLCQMAGV